MKRILFALLFFTSLVVNAANYPPAYFIPAAGQTINTLTYFQVANQHILVSTNGAVTLGSNTYTLTYATLPGANTTWWVTLDASNLTLNAGSQVNIFGETPLATYPGITKFVMEFNVWYNASGTPTKTVRYLSSIDNILTPTGTVNFPGRVNFDSTVHTNDSLRIHGPVDFDVPLTTFTNRPSLVTNDSGVVGAGCAPWCITGNSGLSSATYFLGNTDTANLRFRVNNVSSGLIDYNRENTSFGYSSLIANTTGQFNTAIGHVALQSNNIGASNVAVGNAALSSNSSGNQNTAIGTSAGASITSGANNTGVGSGALLSLTTGSNNTVIGSSASLATNSTSYGIALGQGAIASSNQLSIAGIRSIYLSGVTSGVDYVLTDSSGTGNFIPKQIPVNQQLYLNPVTGDSSIATKWSTVIQPAGTIADFTIRLPSLPYSGQILNFYFDEAVTNVHWSTALEPTSSVSARVPVTAAAGSVIEIQYNIDTLTWYKHQQ